MDKSVSYEYYKDSVSCIDRQIEELKARRDAILQGYCYTGLHDYYTDSHRTETFTDPYNLLDVEVEKENK